MDGGDRGVSQEKITIMNHVMLRFRPIAPKPVLNGSDSSYPDLVKKEVIGKKRTKRKYVRANKNVKRNSVEKKKKRSDDETSSWFDETETTHVVTLELLPGGSVERASSHGSSDLRGAESWVSMECVTGGFGHGRRMGRTDAEKVRSLERDTCPGFVSDGDGGVKWVNLAYRRMVNGPAGEEGVVVWLMNKERIPVGMDAFSCRVRVEYGGRGKVVPCDVWRMDGELGLYAWRLDLEAALSLGR